MKLTGHPAGIAALVAGVAVGNGDASEGLVRNVIGCSAVGRRISTAVAGGALVHYRSLRMVPLAGFPSVRAMAAHAVRCSGNMVRSLAGCRATVVATGAIGGCVEQAVVRLGAGPGASGFVTTFAVARDRSVYRRSRFPGRPKTGIEVTGGALRRYGNVAVEGAGCPAGISAFMTRVTVCDCYTA